MPRILILVQNEPVPSDRHVWNQCLALVRAGYEVTVVCPRGADRDHGIHEERDGVAIHRYDPRPADGGALSFAAEYASALWHIRRLARRLARERPFDLVHACSPPDFLLLSVLALRRQGARFVFDHHDLTPELYASRFGGAGGAMHRIDAGGRAGRLPPGGRRAVGQRVLPAGGTDPRPARAGGRRAWCAPGRTCTASCPPSPIRRCKRGRAHLLSYVGVMGPQDGVDHALRALAALRCRRDDWHAIFMGSGEVLNEMRELAAELGLADVVEFTGWVEPDTICRVLSTLRRLPRAGPEEPAQRRLVDGEDLRVHGDVTPDRLLRPAGVPRARPATPRCTPTTTADFARLVDELLADPQRRARMGDSRTRARRAAARLGAPGARAACRLRPGPRHGLGTRRRGPHHAPPPRTRSRVVTARTRPPEPLIKR